MLVHTVPDVDTMRSHIDKAKAHNIDYMYVTDDVDELDNPWDSLPTFWRDEIDYLTTVEVGSWGQIKAQF